MMKTPHQFRIEQFMRCAQQEIPTRPTLPTEDVRRLRAALILEETMETIEALGFKLCLKYDSESSFEFRDLTLEKLEFPRVPPSLVQIADGCADLSVVTIGTLSACGIQDVLILEAVDMNNLQKFGPGGYRDGGGKWIKPPNHQPPDFKSILESQK